MLIFFLDQNLALFRMVDLIFLPAESYALKMEVESKQSFRE